MGAAKASSTDSSGRSKVAVLGARLLPVRPYALRWATQTDLGDSFIRPINFVVLMKSNIRDLEDALGYAMARFKIDQTERNFQKMLDFAHNHEMCLDQAALERVNCRAKTLLLEWYHDGKAVMGPNGLTKKQ